MKVWLKVALGELLCRSDEPAVTDPAAEYHEVTIKLWGKGVVSRGKVRGSDVMTSRRAVRANQLILSKIDARNGAIGLVPPELDSAIVSNDFPSFYFRDEWRCDPAFMGWLVRSASFVELCKAASEGTTNRVRIKESRFLEQQIALPPMRNNNPLFPALTHWPKKHGGLRRIWMRRSKTPSVYWLCVSVKPSPTRHFGRWLRLRLWCGASN
jgi:type I restriction enzyme S subunit